MKALLFMTAIALRHSLALTLISGVALSLYYIYDKKKISSPHLDLVVLSQPIETYIEQGEFVRFDKETGLKKEQLFLHSAYHLKDHTVTHLTHPKLIRHPHNTQNKLIELSAQQAQAIHMGPGSNDKIQKIIFSKDVCLTNTPFILNTSILHYDPEFQLAKTDALIHIFSDTLQIQAKGMTIHLGSGKMTLLNQVTSQHEYNHI